MSESEERNKRLLAEAEQIETESREVAEEAWAEVDPRAVQLAADIRSLVEEVRRLREALRETVAEFYVPECWGDFSNEVNALRRKTIVDRAHAALAGEASE